MSQEIQNQNNREIQNNGEIRNISMEVDIAGVKLKNPVMEASGTFGSGEEYSEFVDLNQLGAVVTKGVANVPWPGNPTPRIAETYGGMINAIGLQNPGVEVFAKRDIPFLKKYDTKIVVNVCGKTTEDYIEVVERLRDEPVDLLEIKGGGNRLRPGPQGCGSHHQGGEGPREAAHYHEAESQRDGHHGDGKSGGGRGSGRHFPD